MPTDFERGFLVGVLVGEGHFGGDGRQPQVTLRMHVRHAALFRWIERTFPGGRLYGPYNHGGRQYYQWMARGVFLRDEIVPLLARTLSPELDAYSLERFQQMMARYGARLGNASLNGRTEPQSPGERLGRRHASGSEEAASKGGAPSLSVGPADLEAVFDLLRREGS
jgi:hypothetical protein